MRKIFEVSNQDRMVRVYLALCGTAPLHGEYVARLYVAGKLYEPADYFADDKQDAIDTAMEMVKPLPKVEPWNMGQAVTITDPLVRMFGRTRSQIESAIRASKPDSALRKKLLERQGQVARAWKAFQSNPSERSQP